MADVFERFTIADYAPAIILSAPALSWDTVLNMTKVELELISDADMYLFFKRGMGGKVSYISTRFSNANNK